MRVVAFIGRSLSNSSYSRDALFWLEMDSHERVIAYEFIFSAQMAMTDMIGKEMFWVIERLGYTNDAEH